MGASSRYTSVPQSEEADLDQRPAKVRAQDFHALDAAEGGSDVDGLFGRRRCESAPLSWYTLTKRALYLAVLVTLALALGFCAGSKHRGMKGCGTSGHDAEQQGANGLLAPQSLVPDSTWSLGSLIVIGGRTFGGEQQHKR